MPAIDQGRLRIQSANLVENFQDPPAFLRALRELLELYTNHTLRRSQSFRHVSMVSHNTPNPVLRQIQSEMASRTDAQPADAVVLTEALWKEGTFEARLLASRLLGMIPLQHAIPALSRLPDWLAQSPDKEIRAALLTDALARMRSENPEAFFTLLEAWLRSPRTNLQVWGLRAIIPLLQDPDFENLPAAFRILRPAIEKAGPSTQMDLLACLQALTNLSPTETMMFLSEILARQPNPMLVRTLRRMLPSLHPELQGGLRDLLRAPV